MFVRLEKSLMRLALRGRLPFSRLFLAWRSRRQLKAREPVSFLRYNFEIPNLSQPIPEDQRGAVGPRAQLIPFVPEPLLETNVTDRRIDEVLTLVGTYGMGGAGFFGLRLDGEWLVVAIWGASEWIRVDGILVQDRFFERSGRPKPWIDDGTDRLSPRLVGTKITSLEVERHSMQMLFANGMSLAIDEASDKRPVWEGSKKPRLFLAADDLRKAVFLAPTAEIWV